MHVLTYKKSDVLIFVEIFGPMSVNQHDGGARKISSNVVPLRQNLYYMIIFDRHYYIIIFNRHIS